MKTAGKVIGYILLVALLLAGVGLIWRYTNGFNENFRTFYVEYGGERILTFSSALDFTGGTEVRFGVGYTFDVGEEEPRGYGVKIAANAEEDFDFTADGKNYAWSRQTDITEAFDIERGADYFVLKFPEEFSIEGVLETLYPDAEIEAGTLSDKARYYTLVVSSYNGEEVCEIDFSVQYPYEIRVQTEKDGPVQGEPTVDVPEYAQAGERIEFTIDFQGITSPYTLTGVGIQPFSSGEVQMLTEEDGKYSFVMPEDNVFIIVYLEYIV